MPSCFELFAGCGGAGKGMSQAGYDPTGGIEWYQPAADIYNANHSIPVTVMDLLKIDRIPTVDLLWASPVCKRFSRANIKRGETDEDTQVAQHIAKLMVDSRPRHIAIENVRDYEKSASLDLIWTALDRAGYQLDIGIYNAANYGAPTTRERLIVRASLDPLSDVIPTHRNPILNRADENQLSLFPIQQLPDWIGWYEAIADRLDELPASSLTDKQKSAIAQRFSNLSPNELSHCILVDTTQSRPGQSSTAIFSDPPTFTITAEITKRSTTRAKILIERVGYFNLPKIYNTCPAPTIRSAPHIDDKGSYRVVYNIIDEKYRVFAADIRCLAAWSGFPLDYRWGNNRGEAGRAIGNAVPPPLARQIALSFA